MWRDCVPKPVQKVAEFFPLVERDGDPGKYSADIGSVISVVEEGNIPRKAKPIEKVQERSRPFWEFEAIDDFVCYAITFST